MNDIIHLLPDSVANQIAAGEVIKCPASIIKELVENSLDAGATRIQIIVTDAGKTCVQVIDNGKGMSETDARLSFERHATSKIKDAADLFALTTMGFRGEALASIAAVAQVELRTRREEDELGVQINIEGSKVTNQESVVCPVGANFIVKNLFFNTPARRRFLRSDRTELKTITDEFERIALAHPEVSFSLATPHATLFDLPASSFRQRIVNIFGKNIDKKLLNVQVDTSVVKVVGFVGSPESSKKKCAEQFFFVNGRYMKEYVFAAAVMAAYERLIPDGDKIPFFLQLFVDPEKIDVNIHPEKTEIKFEDRHTIYEVLKAAVRESLGKFNAIPTIDFDTSDRPDIPIFDQDTDATQPEIIYDPNFNPFDDVSQVKGGNAQTSSEDYYKGCEVPSSNTPFAGSRSGKGGNVRSTTRTTSSRAYSAPPYSFTDSLSIDSQFTETQEEDKKLFETLPLQEQQEWEAAAAEYLQYRGKYMLTAVENGLLIIDISRAHTRVLYEDYIRSGTEKVHDSQGLLFAHLLELTPKQSAILEAMSTDVEALGFSISPLGNGAFSIMAVPSGIEGMDPVQLLQNIVDDAADAFSGSQDKLLQSAALTLSRRTAIPVGQHLSQEEMRELASKLFQTSNPNLTPDGKLILTILPHESIVAKFK